MEDDEEFKLTLHGLPQYASEQSEKEESRKLKDTLDVLEFDQAAIFVGPCGWEAATATAKG